jgi:predicted RNA-binding protein YlqC (UPF0109 family)
MVGPTIAELLKGITEALVDHVDQVKLNELHSDQAYIFELQVAKEDVGKVIGRGGKTAMAIRTILEAASGKQKKRVILEILE